MEIFKKIILGVSRVVLFFSLFLLLSSFAMDGMVRLGISSIVSESLMQDSTFDDAIEDKEKINELFQKTETQEFVRKYFEPVISGDVDISKVNLGGDILEFVEHNKEKIEEVIGQPIDMERVEEFTKSKEMATLNDGYIEVVSKANDAVPTEVKNVIKICNFILSGRFRIMMGLISLLTIVIIAFIKKSYYDWIGIVGNDLIGCGSIVLIGSVGGLLVLNAMFDALKLGNITFKFGNVAIVSGGAIVVGIILKFIYKILDKKFCRIKTEA